MGASSNSLRRLWQALQQLAAAWSDDRCARRAAAVSFYTAFSLAPILVIVLAVAGFVVETNTLSGAIVDETRMLIGDAGAELLKELLAASRNGARQGWAALAAFGVLIVGATTAFAELKDSLDELFGQVTAAPEGLMGLVRARLLSFGLVLVLAFLLLISLALSAILAVASSYVFGREVGWVLRGLSWLVTLVVVIGLLDRKSTRLNSSHLGISYAV